jgi:hypothetical protein
MSDNTTSRFDELMTARHGTELQQPPPLRETVRIPNDATPQVREAPKRGRPVGGKRGNPEYEQVTAYIPKELYKRVKIRLLETTDDAHFSDLVEHLLTNWVSGKYRA